MPRLWLISHNYAPEATGIPVYNTGMARWFAARGWDVEVLTGMPHYPWWKVPEDYEQKDYRSGRADEWMDGVHVHRVRHFVPAPPVSAKARMALDASYLRAWFARAGTLAEKPDVIIGVAPPFLIGTLLLWLRRKYQVPVVYHIQDLQVDAALDLGMLPAWSGYLLRASEAWQLARLDLVTTCGRGMLKRIAAKTQLKLRPRHWPNWADLKAIAPWEGSNPEREKLRVSADAVVGLYSGNLGRKQGVEVLLEATRLLRDEPAWRTVIAGAGAERAALAAHLAGMSNAQLEDLRPIEQLNAFLGAGDIHIIPQRRCAADLVLPSKLLNILAAGRAVVVTADPGSELHDVVVASGAGLAVPPENPEALAEALRSLVRDPQRRLAMGQAGRRWIMNHLSIDKVLGRIEHDVQGLIRAHAQQRPASAAPAPKTVRLARRMLGRA
jgi:colanic acid biosynthesis glycosyl transferase WcaI